ncbi:hypothetical protein AOLI_G00237390 [Acnodon oligacanthus]
MTKTHGTSPPRRVRELYAKGIVSLFPYLKDPYSKNGYEHYYDSESGSDVKGLIEQVLVLLIAGTSVQEHLYSTEERRQP